MDEAALPLMGMQTAETGAPSLGGRHRRPGNGVSGPPAAPGRPGGPRPPAQGSAAVGSSGLQLLTPCASVTSSERGDENLRGSRGAKGRSCVRKALGVREQAREAPPHLKVADWAQPLLCLPSHDTLPPGGS